MNHDKIFAERAFRPMAEDPARSPTLPGYFYHHPAVFEEEKELIFYRSWHIAGHVSQVKNPGDYVCNQLIDQKYFLIRGKDGVIRAFYNVCQHRAHELLKGQGNVRRTIVCPYHAWAYDLDGSLRAARSVDKMPEFDPKDYGLAEIRLEERLGILFINLSDEAPGLDETYAGLFEDIETSIPWIAEAEVMQRNDGNGPLAGVLQANWKVMSENCLECYHCTPAHPAFVDIISLRSYRVADRGQWMKSSGALAKGENKAYAVKDEDPVRDSHFWNLFPSSEIGVMPGTRAAVIFTFAPITPETSRLTSLVVLPPGEPVPQARMDYTASTLWPEDEGLVMSVHQGLKSKGYRQGRFVVDPDKPGISENGVHHFQRLYAKAMGL